MKKIGFITCQEFPDLHPSDELVAQELMQAGVDVVVRPWNESSSEQFIEAANEIDMIVVRSTWDYPASPAAFRQWLIALQAHENVVNGPALMHWNFTKRYLMHLAVAGAPVPPTRFVAPARQDLANAMAELGVDEAIVKPVIGATASGLSRICKDDPAGLTDATARLGQAGLVQPFIREIQTLGETSMIFIDGQFTHAVVKRPKAGDIRVQEEFGGQTARCHPGPSTIAAAQSVLKMLPHPPVYARIDAIIFDAGGVDERLQLMEVEVIEPELFFTHAPEAVGRFADALLKRLN